MRINKADYDGPTLIDVRLAPISGVEADIS
jgi:hypothetical protein